MPLRGFLTLLLAACVLISCSSNASRSLPAVHRDYSPETPTKRGGTVVFSDWEFPDSFNMVSATATTDLRAGALLFAPLWGLDSALKPYPDLVREVPTVENGDVRFGTDGKSMSVDVKLVRGLRWSDGQPLTVDDVAFTWQAICDPATAAATTLGFDHIASMQKKSDTEVTWNFAPGAKGRCGSSQPISSGVYAAYLELGPQMWLMPKHRLEKVAHANWTSDPFFSDPDVASGPFAVAEIVPGDRITFNANPHYGDGRQATDAYTDTSTKVRLNHAPYLDQLVYRIYGDKNSTLDGLKGGESDLVFHLAPADLHTVRSLRTSFTVVVGGLQDEFLNPNHAVNAATHRLPPWVTANGQDPAVLEALSAAVNRTQLVQSVLQGAARPSRALYPSAMQSYKDPNLPNPDTGVDAAKQILDADGWTVGGDGVRVKNGRRLAFSLLAVCSNAERAQELDFLKKTWASIGASVKTDCRKRALFFASFSDGGTNATGSFDMTVYSNTWQPDPSSWAPVGESSGIPNASNPLGENWNRCRDPRLDHDFAAGDATLAQAQRHDLYLDAQREWLAYHCTIPLFEWPEIVQVSNKLHNFAANPGLSMDVWNAADWWVSQ